MKQVTSFDIGKKVRWYCEGIVDKEVVIASEIVGKRVRIDRIGKTGIVHKGGYVNTNELYEIETDTEIKEHDIVSSLIATEEISVGDKGTVVHIYPNGKAYEVEFADKKLVTTMRKGQIEKYKSTKTNL